MIFVRGAQTFSDDYIVSLLSKFSLLQKLTVNYPCALSLSLSVQCVFLIWCMAPVSWNGSRILYTRVIRPFFLKHEATMDNVVNNLSSTAKTITGTVTKDGEMLQYALHSWIQFLIVRNNLWKIFLCIFECYFILLFWVLKKSFLPSAVSRALSHDKSHWASPDGVLWHALTQGPLCTWLDECVLLSSVDWCWCLTLI